jgi:ribosomal-protein-alanine N-acetyltransferase
MDSLAIVRLEGPRVIVRSTVEDDAGQCLAYFERNKKHLEPWEPDHDETFYTEGYWRGRIRGYEEQRSRGTLQRMCIFERPDCDVVVGAISLMAVTPCAPVWNARVGYSIDQQKEGRGLMSEALGLVIRYAFEDLNLKRLLAGYVPQNSRSARVLERAGFVKEGYHREYLFVGGKWEDHVETSLINRAWKLG